MYRILVVFLLFLPVDIFADVASTNYVDVRVASQVQTTGDQEIAGTKTFAASPMVPTPPLPTPPANTTAE